jgi:antirestriction protein ArdC
MTPTSTETPIAAPATLKRDFRQEVTDNIVAMLEKGVAPWQKPWDPAKASLELPHNPTTDKAYRGGNAIHLLAVGLKRGYEDPRWMTYLQAQEQGWQVRKGEKGTQIEFWQFPDHETRGGKTKDSPNETPRTEDERRGLIHRVYTVFNGAQIEGIAKYEPKLHPEWEVVQTGEAILKNSGAQIHHDQQDRAFYSRLSDTIHLPTKTAFPTQAEYYGTALHELGHWTGHPDRLNRLSQPGSYVFGSQEYAKEELRAELTSVFLSAERGIPHNAEQHASYLQSWIRGLKNDKNEIFRAAKDAHQAADLLLDLERGLTVEEALKGDRTRVAREKETAKPDGLNAPGIAARGVTGPARGTRRGAGTPSDEGTRRETSEFVAQYEKGSGTVDITEKPTATEHRSVTPSTSAKGPDRIGDVRIQQERIEDNVVAFSNAEVGASNPKDGKTSLDQAKALIEEKLGKGAHLQPVQTDSGIYRGPLIGSTDGHVIQQLTPSVAVAHPKDLLPSIPNTGQPFQIQYNNQHAMLKALEPKARGKELGR